MATNLISNVKYTNKGDAVTDANIDAGEGAFSFPRDSVFFNYGDTNGVKEHKFITDAERSKLTNVPADTSTAISTAQSAAEAAQAAADGKVASVTAGTGITIGGDAQHPVINATSQKIDQYSSTETPTGAIGTTLSDQAQSALTAIGTAQGLSEGDTVIYANSYQATVTEVTGDSSTGTYKAVIFFVPTAATFATLGGNPTDNTALKSALDAKADTSAIPTVNDATVTINAYGSAAGSFTLNQAGAATINIPEPTINLVTREI